MLKVFDSANQAILKRVQELEQAIQARSQEIKQESKDAFNEAIERTRRIKQAHQILKEEFSQVEESED